jgi:hypothetical protein
MKRRLAVIALFIVFSEIPSFSQEADYSVSSISEVLKKDAAVVFRLDEAVLNIESPSKYVFTAHQVITILSPEGSRYLDHSIGIGKFNRLQDVQVKMISSSGAIEKVYKKNDFETFAAYDGISLVTDDKVMTLHTSSSSYPCTIDVYYEMKVSGYIELPDWSISTTASTERFRYTVRVPSEIDIRYKTANLELTPVIKDSVKVKTYVWEATNIPARPSQAGGFIRSGTAVVQIAPNVFEYDGYRGNFKSWRAFGAWCYSLYNEVSPFTKERAAEIQALASRYNEPRQKIAVLYEDLKKNMRYVSIQLGIGGFKPFPSKFVDEKKYGDCKALTNYMRNALTVAGIRSYPALVNAGYNNPPADVDFPSSPFNHVILCIPLQNDTMWLECTSTTAEPGYLGSFTENKHALLLTEDGGRLVKTPASNYTTNQLITLTEIKLDEDLAAKVKQEIYGTGSFRGFFKELNKVSGEKQMEYLSGYMHYRNSDQYQLVAEKDSSAGYKVAIELLYNKYYDFKTGNKWFLQQHIYKLANEAPAADNPRTVEYLFHEPYQKKDLTRIITVQPLKWENIPEPRKIDVGGFSYVREVRRTAENILEIETTLTLRQNIVPASEYKNAVIFFNDVMKEEAKKLVIIQ